MAKEKRCLRYAWNIYEAKKIFVLIFPIPPLQSISIYLRVQRHPVYIYYSIKKKLLILGKAENVVRYNESGISRIGMSKSREKIVAWYEEKIVS